MDGPNLFHRLRFETLRSLQAQKLRWPPEAANKSSRFEPQLQVAIWNEAFAGLLVAGNIAMLRFKSAKSLAKS